MFAKSLYNSFRYSNSEKVSDLLHNTKRVILNNVTYNNYLTSYMNHTQISSFKEPNKTSYPLLHNSKYIPLKKQNELCTIDTEASMSTAKKKQPIRLHLCTQSTMNNFHEDLNNNSKDNMFFMTENNSGSFAKEKKRPISCRPRSAVEIPEIKRADIFLLVDVIFNEERFKQIVYDESKIFHHEEYYVDYMKRKIIEMKKIKEYKEKSNEGRKFKSSKGIIEVILQSARMEIRNNVDSKSFYYEIPFEYLPILYMNSFDNIKLLFMNLFEKKIFTERANEKVKKLIQREMLNVLKYEVDSDGEYNITHENSNNITIEKEIIEEFHTKYQQNVDDISIVNDIILFEEKKIDANDYLLTNLYIEPRKEVSNILFNKSTKRFSFNWATCDCLYTIDITMPEITVKFKTLCKQVNHFIDRELMIYLLRTNFSNWDFYCIYYLFSLKRFRAFIKSILSKQMKPNAIEGITIKNVNNIQCVSLVTANHVSKNISMSDKQLTFLFTDEQFNMNHLFILNSYFIYIYYPELNFDKIFSFDFTFHQMKILYILSKKEPLNDFILKILLIDRKSCDMKIDYSFFDLFNNKTIKEIEDDFIHVNHQYELSKNTTEKKLPSNHEIRIKVLLPFSEIITLKSKKSLLIADKDIWKRKQIKLQDDTISKLINCDIDHWVEILMTNEIYRTNEYNDKDDDFELEFNPREIAAKKTCKTPVGNRKGLFELSRKKSSRVVAKPESTHSLARNLRPKYHQSTTLSSKAFFHQGTIIKRKSQVF